MALDRFSDNEVPGSGRRPHDKLISVYDRLSLAAPYAVHGRLDHLGGRQVSSLCRVAQRSWHGFNWGLPNEHQVLVDPTSAGQVG